jgi:predicted ATP-grasp superfamily ATP-dependent carboligase
MSDNSQERDRVAELEVEVDRLRERVEEQREVLSILAAAQQSESLPDLGCPYCGEGTLVGSSGISWTQVQCTACDFKEYL